MECPDCESTDIRTFSNFNESSDRWEWLNGCNNCPWEKRNEDEEKLYSDKEKKVEKPQVQKDEEKES